MASRRLTGAFGVAASATISSVLDPGQPCHTADGVPLALLLVPKPAGRPDQCLFGHTFGLKQALPVTGAPPVTAAYSPVTPDAVVGRRATGAVTSVTGRGPVSFSAYLRGFWLLFGPDRRDRPVRWRRGEASGVRVRPVPPDGYTAAPAVPSWRLVAQRGGDAGL